MTLLHLGSLVVNAEDGVVEGETIGTVGPSGDAELDVPYVHLGIRLADDPKGYIDPVTPAAAAAGLRHAATPRRRLPRPRLRSRPLHRRFRVGAGSRDSQACGSDGCRPHRPCRDSTLKPAGRAARSLPRARSRDRSQRPIGSTGRAHVRAGHRFSGNERGRRPVAPQHEPAAPHAAPARVTVARPAARPSRRGDAPAACSWRRSTERPPVRSSPLLRCSLWRAWRSSAPARSTRKAAPIIDCR